MKLDNLVRPNGNKEKAEKLAEENLNSFETIKLNNFNL